MNLPDFHPFWPFLIAAVLALVTRGPLRAAILLAAPLLGLVHLLDVPGGAGFSMSIMDLRLEPYRVDRLSLMFGYLFHIGAFLAVLFSLHVRDTMQQVTGILYAGSAVGAVFAGDLITLFVFWEILALSSAFLVWASRDERSVAAGIRYLIYQVLSGVLLMAGLIWHIHATGSATFTEFDLGSPAAWLIFVAFGIKAGFPLLHNWITDAYPASTPTGTVFLCAFTTKVAIYALARGFPGAEPLIYIGAVMACYPIFFAVIENDLRRVLSYSMMNQLGFMVCGIGIGTSLALNGAVAHAFNDVFFKGLLFMSMGAVLYVTGRSKASDLGGLYRSMPVTATLCIIGAMTISAFPLFSAFVSKSMIMAALLEEGHVIVWFAMLFASAGVLEHAGIKIPYFAFFAHDAGIEAKEPPKNMLLAMALAAAVCLGIGFYPGVLYSILPFEVDYTPYDMTHVLTQLQLLAFAILGVVFLHRSGRYPAEIRATNIDAEWLWRKALPAVARGTVAILVWIRQSTRGLRDSVRQQSFYLTRRQNLQSALARNWPTGSMVLWVGVFLAVMLLAGVIS
ncbi:MAG: Na(+)/H(+) antiporter subunit D [Woeseiaceae bacterium]|nr:Na(+)/H(+) antiporter subunit D [Woeseiaceae bacterium]